MKVNHIQAKRMIIKYIKAGIVPLLKGSPGMGKSSIYAQIAQEFNLLLIDLRLGQCDPTDLLGFPQIFERKLLNSLGQPYVDKRAGYIPMETFPLEGDELPIKYDENGAMLLERNAKGEMVPQRYAGWMLLLDEFTSTGTSVQAASYKIVLDRMVGQRRLHKKVAVCCAGNLETDGAIVMPMSTAMQSRLAHMELILDPKGFIHYAQDSGWDHRITDYLEFKPDCIYTFKPDHTDDTYACGRSWWFTDKILKTTDEGDPDRRELIGGVISEGVMREFMAHMEIYDRLPKQKQIEADPEGTVVPDEPSILWALAGSIAQHVEPTTFKQVAKYLNRLPKEFQVITLRNITRRRKEFVKLPEIQAWVAQTALEHF